MANRADFVTRSADLSDDFGLKMAQEYFAADLLDGIPVYQKGKRKGAKKACIEWIRCVRGGWVGHGADENGAVGYVEHRVGKIVKVILRHAATYDPRYGDWIPGRVICEVSEKLAARLARESENAARAAMENAKAQADRLAIIAELQKAIDSGEYSGKELAAIIHTCEVWKKIAAE